MEPAPRLSLCLRRTDGLLQWPLIRLAPHAHGERVLAALSISLRASSAFFANLRAREGITKRFPGKPRSNGRMPSRCVMCASESAIESASMFACRCSTLRPPMMGNTYGAFCITYAIATARRGPSACTRIASSPSLPTGLYALRANLACDMLERGCHLALICVALPLGAHQCAPVLTRASALVLLRVSADATRREDVPRRERHACVRAQDSCGADVTWQQISPSLRAMGMMSRSKSRASTFHLPW
jgi:hypothetical protein